MVESSNVPTVEGIENLIVIGRGGFATVYRGHQPAFHRDVAVKVLQRSELDTDDRRRFERECQAMGALSNHPGIVTLYDAGFTADERPYLVMSYVADGSLQDHLTHGGPMPWREVTVLGVRLAAALETAHRAGVVHRDVKPANVLRSAYGEQLTDFGIARLQGGHETLSGVITASVAHAAPEILDGEPPGVRADIYSLGSTLYAALAGTAAYVRATDEGLLAMIHRVGNAPIPDLRERGVPDALALTVEKAMAKNPDDRYETAEDFGHAICDAQAALGLNQTDLMIVGGRRSGTPPPGEVSRDVGEDVDDGSGPTVVRPITPDPPPPSATPPADSGGSRRIVPIAIGGAALAVIAGAAFFFLAGDDDSPDDAADGTTLTVADSVVVAETPVADTVPDTVVDTVVDTAAETVAETAPPPPPEPPAESALLATTEVAPDASVDGTLLTGIDGIAYDPFRQQLLAAREPAPAAVSEATPELAEPAAFTIPIQVPTDGTEGDLALDVDGGSAVTLRRDDGSAYGAELDVEGMAVLDDGSYYVVSEGNDDGGGDTGFFAHRFDPDGNFVSQLSLPPWYLTNAEGTQGFAPRRGLHGIDQRPGTPGQVVVIVEAPLIQDQDPDVATEPKTARIIAFDVETGEATAEWGYPLDVLGSAAAEASGNVNLVVDMAALSDGSLAVLENIATEAGREFVLYRVRLDDGVEPSDAIPPLATKTPIPLVGGTPSDVLFEFRSITAGPQLSDGRASLILATDNLFEAVPTEFAMIAIGSTE